MNTRNITFVEYIFRTQNAQTQCVFYAWKGGKMHRMDETLSFCCLLPMCSLATHLLLLFSSLVLMIVKVHCWLWKSYSLTWFCWSFLQSKSHLLMKNMWLKAPEKKQVRGPFDNLYVFCQTIIILLVFLISSLMIINYNWFNFLKIFYGPNIQSELRHFVLFIFAFFQIFHKTKVRWKLVSLFIHFSSCDSTIIQTYTFFFTKQT